MSKAAELKELYDEIGGLNAPWISTIQQAYSIEPNPLDYKPLLPEEYFDIFYEEGYSFKTVESIIDIERKGIHDFNLKIKEVERLIKSSTSDTYTIDKILEELDDLVDMIRISYIVVGPEYEKYYDKLEELKDLYHS
jgi:hypothetical protein